MSGVGRRSSAAPLALACLLVTAMGCAACRQRTANPTTGDASLAGREQPAKGKGKPMTEPKIDRNFDFSQVERTFTAYPCTPALGPDHENVIRINAPEEVTFRSHGDDPLGEDTHFVICGAMQMRSETLGELGFHGDELEGIMLVAVDAKTNKTYTGAIGFLGTRLPMPEELKKPTTPGYLIGESFNPNLVRSFDLPPVETDYFVHAVLGPFKSNVLKVRLRRAK